VSPANQSAVQHNRVSIAVQGESVGYVDRIARGKQLEYRAVKHPRQPDHFINCCISHPPLIGGRAQQSLGLGRFERLRLNAACTIWAARSSSVSRSISFRALQGGSVTPRPGLSRIGYRMLRDDLIRQPGTVPPAFAEKRGSILDLLMGRGVRPSGDIPVGHGWPVRSLAHGHPSGLYSTR
jgi:hypothetical protein